MMLDNVRAPGLDTTAVGPTPEIGGAPTPKAPALSKEQSVLVVGPEDGYGALRLVRTTLQPGFCSELPPDPDSDQLIMVICGRARVIINGRAALILSPDEVVHVPRGTSPAIEAVDVETVELLILAAS